MDNGTRAVGLELLSFQQLQRCGARRAARRARGSGETEGCLPALNFAATAAMRVRPLDDARSSVAGVLVSASDSLYAGLALVSGIIVYLI